MEESPEQSRVEGHVLVKKSGRVCTITMNRPQVMNALNIPLMTAMVTSLENVGSDPGYRVVVVDGAGGNFCAGADMSLLNEGRSSPDWVPVMMLLGRLIRTIRDIPQPVISKVLGAAIGGGANLALAADFVVAGHNARFGQVFVNLGVGLDGGGTYFLPRLVGVAKARELALLGETISGKEAASIGLIFKSVSQEDLESEVDALAARLAEKSLSAMALIKRSLDRALKMSLSEVLEMEAAQQAIMFQSQEHREAVRSFLVSRGRIETASPERKKG